MTVRRGLMRAAGALTVLIGLLHLGVGWTSYPWPSFDTLWFHGSGVAVMLVGAMTLLAASSQAWTQLRVVAAAANLLGLALAIAFGMLSQWRAVQGPILLVLFAVGTIGCMPAIRLRNDHSPP